MTRIAINGFGRIGRAAFKVALARDDVEVVAINDLGEVENLAYLLRYDSVYGRYAEPVEVGERLLTVRGVPVQVFQESAPEFLPWKELKIDVVVESTGVFTTQEKAAQHLSAGARCVVISAPTESEGVPTVVSGVNDEAARGQKIVSNASCTTNCVSPVMAVLAAAFGVEKALMTTVHAYTATQSLVDGPARKDPRRGRAAALNLVPSATGAADAVTKTLPKLEGKFDGVSLRMPVPVVSLSDITCILSRSVTVDEISEAFRAAASDPAYRGVIAVTSEPVVSTDFVGDPHSAVVDLSLTRVVAGDLVKVMAWYDNEWGYANRLVEQAIAVAGYN